MRSFTGDELFIDNGTYMDFSLSDFWQWYASDLLNHPIRGAIAEFLVAKAIGVPTDSRPGWRSYDLLYKGKKIEIKSCARVSDSHGGRNNRICFGIPKQLCLGFVCFLLSCRIRSTQSKPHGNRPMGILYIADIYYRQRPRGQKNSKNTHYTRTRGN